MGDRNGLGLSRSLHPMKPAGTALRPAEPRCITISCETTLPQKAITTLDQRLHSSAPLPTKSSCMRRKPGKQHRSLRPTKTQNREAQVLSKGCIHFIRLFSLNITAPFQCRNPLSLRSWQANLLRNADGGFHTSDRTQVPRTEVSGQKISAQNSHTGYSFERKKQEKSHI